MNTLLKKLQYKEGLSVMLAGSGKTEFPELLSLSRSADKGKADFVIVWADNRSELETLLQETLPLLTPNTIFWIAYPKKSSGRESDLHRDEGWEPLKESGYRPVMQVALNEIWTALRFKPGAWPERENKKEREPLVIPAEMMQFLEAESLLNDFQRLSYTHQKEYIQSFEEAKKPETRLRRLQYMAENLRARKIKNQKNNQ
ncbi:MAG: YdeI/OmpD-associated family protein [Bacteroidales bacterium]|jgi:hypothetical protein|nr:YdeI/OmpD-associated family protein [Bacteroidales bacterium]NPV37251.1 YdeI/OmpD-associated family protein [Bacteroidales bacterium]